MVTATNVQRLSNVLKAQNRPQHPAHEDPPNPHNISRPYLPACPALIVRCYRKLCCQIRRTDRPRFVCYDGSVSISTDFEAGSGQVVPPVQLGLKPGDR